MRNKRTENKAAENHNVTMCGGLFVEECSKEIHQHMQAAHETIPDLRLAIRNKYKIICNEKNIPKRKPKRIVVALVIVAAFLLMTGFTVYIVRTLDRVDYETYADYRVLPDESVLNYRVAGLPEGFRLQTVDHITNGTVANYVNENGQVLQFIYANVEMDIGMDNETEQATVELHNQIVADQFKKDDCITLIWRYDNMYFTLAGEFDQQTMKDFANNVVAK